MRKNVGLMVMMLASLMTLSDTEIITVKKEVQMPTKITGFSKVEGKRKLSKRKRKLLKNKTK